MVFEPKKKRRKNPVTALSKGLEEDLRQQGYAASTIWKQRRLFNDLIGWLQGQELAMGDLSMAQVDRFMADRRAAGVRKLKTRKALGPILDHLRGLGLVPAAETPVEDDPAQIILHRYRQFLTTERGLATVTADRYIDCLRPFLDRRMAAGELDLGGLTPADVTSFVVAWCPRLNSGVAKLTVVPRLPASGQRHGTLARARRADGRPPQAGGIAQGARARSGAASARGLRCQHRGRLPRSGDPDPAGPARPSAR
jgi:hypothetical protein